MGTQFEKLSRSKVKSKKILIISNLYPPDSLGGYEIGCSDVTTELAARGWDCRVVTSRSLKSDVPKDSNIHRCLWSTHNETSIFDRIKILLRERKNRSNLKKVIGEFKPDVIYCWSMAGLSLSMLQQTPGMEIPLFFYVSDESLLNFERNDYWWRLGRNGPGFKRYFAKLVFSCGNKFLGLQASKPNIRGSSVQFTSRYIRDVHVKSFGEFMDSSVVPWGITQTFQNQTREMRQTNSRVITCLYAGRLVPEKGILTAIGGLATSRQALPEIDIQLRIAGTGATSFHNKLLQTVDDLKVNDSIHFLGMLSREDLMTEMSRADIFLFPSEWNEPFSISLLEAMASGCAIIGTTTGGSVEILRDGVNALIARPADIEDWAYQIGRLASNRSLREKLGKAGIAIVKSQFTISKMVDAIEIQLKKACEKC